MVISDGVWQTSLEMYHYAKEQKNFIFLAFLNFDF